MIRRPPRSTRTDTSFPTRRSSDLQHSKNKIYFWIIFKKSKNLQEINACCVVNNKHKSRITIKSQQSPFPFRSEEHTSELQSLMRISYAVFCLKKKKYKHTLQISKQNNTKQ